MNPFKQDRFQGNLYKTKYFEGWYFKVLTKDKTNSLVLIPGISLNKEKPHAFIQVFITNHLKQSMQTYYLTFDISHFSFQKHTFYISIKDNIFSKDFIFLNINQKNLKLIGKLHISNHHEIPSNLYQPNVMGPFAYIPFMECNHGILSMDSKVHGNLIYQEKKLDFDDTHMYIEKDYGKSFPSKYIWIQSNHFKQKNDAFMFSYATIPFLKFKFKGLIATLYANKKHYRFTTYNLSKTKIDRINEHIVTIEIKKRKYRLIIKATQADVVKLKSPYQGKMDHEIKEGLSGIVDIQLYKKKQLIFEDTGYYAGIEIMFD